MLQNPKLYILFWWNGMAIWKSVWHRIPLGTIVPIRSSRYTDHSFIPSCTLRLSAQNFFFIQLKNMKYKTFFETGKAELLYITPYSCHDN